jgi:uncharacterized membrane protein YgdD (TMEM256/DUF423 family)
MQTPGTAFVALGALFGLVSVAAGAFGAHGLRDRLPADQMEVFQTAVRYQMWHALALLAVGLLQASGTGRWHGAAGWLFTGGIAVFSGSLYLLVLAGWRWVGPVTPIGGAALLAGWLCLAAGALWPR